MADKIRMVVNGAGYDVEVLSREREKVLFQLAGRQYEVAFENSVSGRTPNKKATRTKQEPTIRRPTKTQGDTVVVSAPIPGIILDVLVNVGDVVEAGDILLRIEAMKMENNIFAPHSGTVSQILVEPGSEVADGQTVVEITG